MLYFISFLNIVWSFPAGKDGACLLGFPPLRHYFRQLLLNLFQVMPAADRLIPDETFFINKVGRGNVLDFVIASGISLDINQCRNGVVPLRHESGDAGHAPAQVDVKNDQSLVLVFIV